MTTYRSLDLVYCIASIISCIIILLYSFLIIILKAVFNLQKRNTKPINKDSRKFFWFLDQIRNPYIWPVVISLTAATRTVINFYGPILPSKGYSLAEGTTKQNITIKDDNHKFTVLWEQVFFKWQLCTVVLHPPRSLSTLNSTNLMSMELLSYRSLLWETALPLRKKHSQWWALTTQSFPNPRLKRVEHRFLIQY